MRRKYLDTNTFRSNDKIKCAIAIAEMKTSEGVVRGWSSLSSSAVLVCSAVVVIVT